MFTDSILVKILIGAAYGVFVGILTIILSKRLTLKRTEDPVKAAPIDKMLFKVMSVVVSVVASIGLMLTATDTATLIRNMLMLVPIASIAVVDALVRKIPNPLLLYMLIVQLGYTIYLTIVPMPGDEQWSIWVKAVFGFIIGFASCAIPGIKLPVGNGDVKYCAIIGSMLYVTTYMQAILMMGVIALGCLIYLKATKKGGIKTLIPMGPLISISTVVSMCFPFLVNVLGNIEI